MNKTVIWGVCADSAGIIRHCSDRTEKLPGGGVRVRRSESLDHEPASSYARTHPSPVPMLWRHGDQVGRIRALRRAHGNLYAVGETELDPDELEALASEQGLRWSTGTNNRRMDPLSITEISLVPEAATIGLPVVRWWKLDAVKGNLPWWVHMELDRAEGLEVRSRGGVLTVHEVADEFDRPAVEHRLGPDDDLEIEYSKHPGRIISVK